MSRRDLTDAERKAWQAATRYVRRLDGRSGPRIKSGNGAGLGEIHVAPEGLRKPNLPAVQIRTNDRTIRRGQQKVEASLDLHGHSQDSAWRILPIFIQQHRARGAKCIIVITGKGKQGDGVLRRNFLMWVESQEARGLVSSFALAHPRHGGGGAFYVYLRRTT